MLGAWWPVASSGRPAWDASPVPTGPAPAGASVTLNSGSGGFRAASTATRCSGVSSSWWRSIQRVAAKASPTLTCWIDGSTPGIGPNAIANRRSAESKVRVPSLDTFDSSALAAESTGGGPHCSGVADADGAGDDGAGDPLAGDSDVNGDGDGVGEAHGAADGEGDSVGEGAADAAGLVDADGAGAAD